MTFSIPLHARITFNSQRVEDEPVLLLDLSDTSLSAPISLCSYPVSLLSANPLQYGVISSAVNANTTYLYAINGIMPTEKDGAELSSTLVLDNVDLSYTNMFVGLSTANLVTLTLVLASTPNEVIRSFEALTITQVAGTGDDGTLTITLGRLVKIFGESDASLEPWPSGRQTINLAPGLHKQ